MGKNNSYQLSLHEEWQWLDGNCDVGSSVIEEM